MKSLYRILSTLILAAVIGVSSVTASNAIEPMSSTQYITPVSNNYNNEISNGSSLGMIFIVIGVTAGIVLYANKKKLIP